MIPYRISTIRKFVEMVTGNVDAFDKDVADAIAFRRDALLELVNSKNSDITRYNFTWGKYQDTRYEYGYYKKPVMSESGVPMALAYFIAPFISNDIFEMMKPVLQSMATELWVHRQKQTSNPEYYRIRFANLLRLFLSEFVLPYDSVLIDWGFIGSSLYWEKRDEVYVGDYNIPKTIMNTYNEVYAHIKGRYSVGRVEFPQYKTKFATVVTIPTGTYLYRGYSDNRAENGLSLASYRTFDFFAFDFFQTSFYAASNESVHTVQEWLDQDSGIAVFRTVRPIDILDLSKADSVRMMQENMEQVWGASRDVKKMFTGAWIITPSGKVKRESTAEIDAKIVDWMCSVGWSGYLGMGTEQLHDEICLCDPRGVLELVHDYKHNNPRDFRNDFLTILDPLQRQGYIVEQ